MIIASQHKIRKQSIEVLTDSEELAIQLQPKISEINKHYLLSVIETIFNEIDVTDQVIKIDKINVDLGWLDISYLNENVNECLADKLRLSLRELLLDNSSNDDEKVIKENKDKTKVITEDIKNSQVKLIEHYLSTGTLPWSYRQSTYFKLDDVFYDVIIDNAKVFTESIKKYGHQQHVIQRMVAQLSRENLRRILYLLEPDDFLLIITYMKELKLIHTSKPVVKLSIDWFERLIWILTLTYSLNQRGSYFNRQSYVKSVLIGIAQREGIEYGILLKALSLGVQKMARKKPLGSSLPGIIGRLIETQHQTDKHWKEDRTTDVAVYVEHSSEKYHEKVGLLLIELEQFLLEDYVSKKQVIEIDYLHLKNSIGQLKSSEYKKIKRLIIRCLKKQPHQSSVFPSKILQLFSFTTLLNIFSVKEEKIISDWIELVSTYINHLDKRLENDIKQELQLGAVQYLLAEQSKSFQIDRMLYTMLANYAEVNQLNLPLLHKSIIQQANQNDTALNSELIVRLSNNNAWKQQRELPTTESLFQAYMPNKKVLSNYDKLSLLEYYLSGDVVFETDKYEGSNSYFFDDKTEYCKSIALTISLLSASQIKSLVSHHNSDEQVLRALRLIEQLTDKDVDNLLKKVVPQSLLKNKLFFQSVYEFASQLTSKKQFFSNLLSEIISSQFENGYIDLESMLSDDKYNHSIKSDKLFIKGVYLSENANDWSQSQLESVIACMLSNQNDKLSKLLSISSLLELLVNKKNVGVRLFFVALYEDSKLYRRLLTHVSGEIYEAIVEVIQPEGAKYLKTLMYDLESAPVAYRCSQVKLRETFFEQAILMQYPLTENLFCRIFQQLYPNKISRPLENHLLTTTNKWREKTDFNPAITSSLELAVNIVCQKQANQSVVTNDNRKEVEGVIEQDDSAYNSLFNYFSKDQMSAFKLTQITQLLIEKAFEHPTKRFQRLLKQKIFDLSTRRLWVENLSESILARIVWVLAPNHAHQLLEHNEVLMNALSQCVKDAEHQVLGRKKFWLFLFEYLAKKKSVKFNLERFVFEFFYYAKNVRNHDVQYFNKKIAASNRLQTENEKTDSHAVKSGVALIESVKVFARRSGQQALLSLLKKRTEQLLDIYCRGKRVDLVIRGINDKNKDRIDLNKTKKQHARLADNDYEAALDDVLYIENSGLILTGAFLPHLFNSLDMLILNEEGKSQFKDDVTAGRAVHLLQYLVNGSVSTPEPLLILNKLMCGQSPEFVVEQDIIINEQEKTICNQLLKALIGRWSSINNTSIEGLQETFFQREGKLTKTNDGWRLKVQRKTVDILLEQITWRTSIISEAWMPEPIHVSWQ